MLITFYLLCLWLTGIWELAYWWREWCWGCLLTQQGVGLWLVSWNFPGRWERGGWGPVHAIHWPYLSCVMLLLVERFCMTYRENINFSHEICIWISPMLIQGCIFWLSFLSFIRSLFNVYDLYKLTRIDAFIYICCMHFSQAEKADGFVNLPDFAVERASECKKKQ